MTDIFDDYYRNNFWGDSQSVSGPGSNLRNTENIRRAFPQLFINLGVNTVLDIPCGDFNWMAAVVNPLAIRYIGADSVPELINETRRKNHGYDFRVLDILKDELPEVDLILCRDLLVHFSHADAKKAIKNILASGSKYLLATTFPGALDGDITTGQWRPIDMERFRYGLGPPVLLIPENETKFNKQLGLWRLR